MAKIEINMVAEIMKRNEVDPAILKQVIEEMNLLVEAQADEEKPPALKKKFCILISDPNGDLPKHDLVGWVLQIPENESELTTQERVFRATYEYNISKRGRLMPAKTVGEAIENVQAKFLKEQNVWVKTKEPVLMLRTDNEIPNEDSEKDTRRGKM